ncbi:MAG: deoxynucleoside kinase [Myxococcales bacterium]|nr:deoxynucleoside kinase [Polyangiaceae bacterium]MDW8248242.1 deoxynucleoside kinase [Myxococcales bacterium]
MVDARAIAERLRYVAIEGCIGVGKTTLTRLLATAFHGRTVLEVVEENPFLPDFYRDKAAHAFKIQVFFLLSRFKQQEQLVQENLFQKNTVADYLFDKDRIFAELTLSASELALYHSVFAALIRQVRVPDVVIYLQAPTDLVLERIRRRGRSFEVDMDRNYLEELAAAYNRFFAAYPESPGGAPTLIVDTEHLNFPERDGDLELILDALSTFPREGERRRVVRSPSHDTPRLL